MKAYVLVAPETLEAYEMLGHYSDLFKIVIAKRRLKICHSRQTMCIQRPYGFVLVQKEGETEQAVV